MSEETRKGEAAAEAPKEAAPAAGGAPEALSPEELAQLKRRAEERDKLFERLQRAVADLDNFQKRAKRDRQLAEDAALRQFVKDLLPVIDDMERLDAALSGALPVDDVRTAVRLLRDKARSVFGAWKIEEIEAVGAPFDPAFHEAVRFEEFAGALAGAVVEDMRRGYTLRGEVLRASQVVVAKAPAAGETPAAENAENAGEE